MDSILRADGWAVLYNNEYSSTSIENKVMSIILSNLGNSVQMKGFRIVNNQIKAY